MYWAMCVHHIYLVNKFFPHVNICTSKPRLCKQQCLNCIVHVNNAQLISPYIVRLEEFSCIIQLEKLVDLFIDFLLFIHLTTIGYLHEIIFKVRQLPIISIILDTLNDVDLLPLSV